ncbi:PQQ-dependent sugar dehydrogenase [Candidatus Saccharibacteria bacterium]|nr:PQQ-dependent sugar dehydrogenase [Candidatus Saccharibacteria bacterium]
MEKGKRLILIIAILIIASGAGLYLFRDKLTSRFLAPTKSNLTQGLTDQTSPEEIITIAQNLSVPWDIAALPGGNGDILVTERTGTLKRIGQNKITYLVAGVEAVGEGGLLGLALDPDFGNNQYVYLYLTTKVVNGLENRVERYKLESDILTDKKIILTGIPGAENHDGGQLSFGPDGKLYISTGDGGKADSAQNINSLSGKILRLNPDGTIPADNPFNNAIYSYGHRNVQGIAWDKAGGLWATEHGRSGISSGYDELNFIEKGANYGWPVIEGDEIQEGMRRPVVHSGENETWAPAGLDYADGSLFFAGLRGSSLYQAVIISNTEVQLTAHFTKDYGRLRAVTVFDEAIYVSSSNTDGRGTPLSSDDKIYRIPLSLFID